MLFFKGFVYVNLCNYLKEKIIATAVALSALFVIAILLNVAFCSVLELFCCFYRSFP